MDNIFQIETAEEMFAKTQDILSTHKLILHYVQRQSVIGNLIILLKKKENISGCVSLECSNQIFWPISQCENRPYYVAGFAAETHNLEQHTKEKLSKKAVMLFL